MACHLNSGNFTALPADSACMCDCKIRAPKITFRTSQGVVFEKVVEGKEVNVDFFEVITEIRKDIEDIRKVLRDVSGEIAALKASYRTELTSGH